MLKIVPQVQPAVQGFDHVGTHGFDIEARSPNPAWATLS